MSDPALARLITLDPAHFHAALVQKQMLTGISPRVSVFAPLGPDLLAHLKLIEQFNRRAENPTRWDLDVHCTNRSLEEMIAARPGNVVVLAGHNRNKIGKIKASLEAGLNILADKPWIIQAEDLPALEAALTLAEQKGLVAFDMMTERHEITTILQRELVNDPDVFGALASPDAKNPSVLLESTHHILKTVAGAPNPRPPFFFDIGDQGEGITDVGTHLVDLVQWTLFPNQALDYRHDVHVHGGRRCARIERLQMSFPGIAAETAGEELHITVPDRYRVGHEAHFAQVVEEFLKHLKLPQSIPAWERPNVLAKYFTTTMGAQMSRSG